MHVDCSLITEVSRYKLNYLKYPSMITTQGDIDEERFLDWSFYQISVVSIDIPKKCCIYFRIEREWILKQLSDLPTVPM